MAKEAPNISVIKLADAVLKHRREKHPYGANYAVRIRIGHAEIQDLTAIADLLSAVEELGYEITKKQGEE